MLVSQALAEWCEIECKRIEKKNWDANAMDNEKKSFGVDPCPQNDRFWWWCIFIAVEKLKNFTLEEITKF